MTKPKAMTDYCKLHRLKFEHTTKDGFVASEIVPIKAGMCKNIETGTIIHVDIRVIGKKRVYTKFKCWSDGDITDGGIVKTEPYKTKKDEKIIDRST